MIIRLFISYMQIMILFSIPYAGGSATIYYKWKQYLHSSIELKPVELKGRGKRFDEELYYTFDEAVNDILFNIKDMISDSSCDYAIYGHSMGSILAYELYYRICEMEIKKPRHLFFSGYQAPDIVEKKEDIHGLADDEFIEKLIEMGGMEEEVISNKELISTYLPIIRNDFKIIEAYKYKEKKEKIGCDISILYGKEDDITLEELLQWKNHSTGKFRMYDFDGDHFFINNHIEDITTIINKELVYR
ncbi:thioesterase [Vallitalea longa]|uniref:Thioesterase n=1 Tax=Vallitalea longa TaxID=2936439 RepID=A0A9W5YG56_9FIRM|nr:thioesterase domain-containing protein [Vallitalea longa]GKX31895.1 thioesterase [Vallitalea longa]